MCLASCRYVVQLKAVVTTNDNPNAEIAELRLVKKNITVTCITVDSFSPGKQTSGIAHADALSILLTKPTQNPVINYNAELMEPRVWVHWFGLAGLVKSHLKLMNNWVGF